jgi:predicted transcriptional regulator
MSSTRLAREVDQKTKQAQKVIEMLKEKKEKKKKLDNQPV